jgi:mannose-1-phosphate guanylyltransferase
MSKKNDISSAITIVPVILAGGSGTRLWPLSREHYPKQLLSLVNEQTMLQNTLARVEMIPEIAEPIIVCTEEHRFLVAEQARMKGAKPSIIIEPVGRDTAPAVAAAAYEASAKGSDPILLILPADHVIREPETFCQAVQMGTHYATENYLPLLLIDLSKNPIWPLQNNMWKMVFYGIAVCFFLRPLFF